MSTVEDWLDPIACPAEMPERTAMGAHTRALHDGIDAHIRQSGHGYLHPHSPTLMLDVLGSAQVVRWQESKAAFLFLGEGCWSELPHLYARYGTGKGQQLIARMRQLEKAACVVLTDCGMQATALTFDALMRPGSHAVAMRQIYNKSRSYLAMLAERLGGSVTIVDDGDEQSLQDAMTEDTALVFCETFTNPLMRAQDPHRLGQICLQAKQRAKGLKLVIDTTIATPWAFETPLLDIPGVDVVVASGTKALAGQDRDMWGYVATNNTDLGNQVMDLVALRGGNLDWRRAAAIVEGLDEAERLHRRRCDNAVAVAAYLQRHPKVAEVHHPSLPQHPDRAAIDAHYKLHGSIVSFRLAEDNGPAEGEGLSVGQGPPSEAAARHFCDVLATSAIVRYALSFDGLATKVNHHKSVSEYFTPPEQLQKSGLSRIIRLAVGTEDVDDLLAILNWTLHHSASVSEEQLRSWQKQRARELQMQL